MSERPVEGGERWRGECLTCGAVIERQSESDIQRNMRGHANELDHEVTVERVTGEDAGTTWLNCPTCHRRYFSMRYDEGTDSLIFTCQECDSEYSFDGIKERIGRSLHTGTEQPDKED